MLANIRRIAALAALLAALTAMVLLAPIAWSQPADAPDPTAAAFAYEAGLEAYDEGQYTLALTLLRRAAAAGDRRAQAIVELMTRLGLRCYAAPDAGVQ